MDYKVAPQSVAGYSCLVERHFLGCSRSKLASLAQQKNQNFVALAAVGVLHNPSTQHWKAIQRTIHLPVAGYSCLVERHFLGCSKSKLASLAQQKNQNFVALAAVGKEAELLRNLILEILLWSKLIAPITILYDSVATLTKAYSQMYNRKSRNLGFRHSMIRELIMNGVVSLEFVRSQQNLVDHLTKELAKDLVLKSVEGMGLKSN
nr:zinc finger, CCHC-type [Tanacetum cinerariifolium]